VADVTGSGFGQQLLDDHFRLLVFAFAEMVMPDMPLRVGEVQRGPVVVVEGTPYRVVVVDRDREVDPHAFHSAVDIVHIVLEPEFRRVYPDNHQSVARVFPGPGPDIGQLTEPVDAGVGPEVDQGHFPAQAGWGQRRRVEPSGRAAERWQLTLDGQPGRSSVQPGGRTPVWVHDDASS
jgi:hypothetical protein